MLFRMYQRYCERRGWKVTVNDAEPGEAIGLNRATFTVSGRNAYGMLRAEQGVHRLVRISPTDAKKRRQTTFAGVEVLPVLPDDVEVRSIPTICGSTSTTPPATAARESTPPTPPCASRTSHGHRRDLPERAQPAPEQGVRHERPQESPL